MSANDNKFLDNIIQLEESHNLEFKKRISDGLDETIIAFANNEGGRIYVGITDVRPRKIEGIDPVKIENHISDVLATASPRPSVDFQTFKYNDGTSEKSVVCVKVHRSDVLVQFKGVFYYRFQNSSHNTFLTLEQIKNRIKQHTLAGTQFLTWVNSFADKKNEYMYFCLAPPSLQPDVFDFLSLRDLEHDMTSIPQPSGVTVSYSNPQFPHPILALLESWKIFRDQDGYTTRDSHTVHEERTGNILRIFREGIVYGRIMYNVILTSESSAAFFIEKLFTNPSLYTILGEGNKFFSEYKIGTMKRALALIIFLLSKGEFPWLKVNFNAFNLKIILPLQPKSILTEDARHLSRRSFLGVEQFISFERDLLIDANKIREELLHRIIAKEQIYQEKIIAIIDSIDNELKAQILSYFGSHSRIGFLGSRKDVHSCNCSPAEIILAYQQKLRQEFEEFPLIASLFPRYCTEISEKSLIRIKYKDINAYFRVSLYEIGDPALLPAPIQEWHSSNLGTRKKPLLLGLEFTQEAPPGFYWDEFVENGSVSFFSGIFASINNVVMARIFDHLSTEEFQDQDFKISTDQFPSLKPCAEQIKNVQYLLGRGTDKGQKQYVMKTEEELRIFQQILSPLEPFSSNQIGIIFGDNIDLKFDYSIPRENKENPEDFQTIGWNYRFHSWKIPGIPKDSMYCFKCGTLTKGVHLIFCPPT